MKDNFIIGSVNTLILPIKSIYNKSLYMFHMIIFHFCIAFLRFQRIYHGAVFQDPTIFLLLM